MAFASVLMPSESNADDDLNNMDQNKSNDEFLETFDHVIAPLLTSSLLSDPDDVDGDMEEDKLGSIGNLQRSNGGSSHRSRMSPGNSNSRSFGSGSAGSLSRGSAGSDSRGRTGRLEGASGGPRSGSTNGGGKTGSSNNFYRGAVVSPQHQGLVRSSRTHSDSDISDA